MSSVIAQARSSATAITHAAAEELRAAPMPPENRLSLWTGQSFTFDGKMLSIRRVLPESRMFSARSKRMTGSLRTAEFIKFCDQGEDEFAEGSAPRHYLHRGRH